VVIDRDALIAAEVQNDMASDDSYFLDIHAAADESSTYKVSDASWDEFNK